MTEDLAALAMQVATMDSAQKRMKAELVKLRDRRDAPWSQLQPLKQGYKSVKQKHRQALDAFERARDGIKKEN